MDYSAVSSPLSQRHFHPLGNAGMTLVEVLVAVFILGILTSGFSQIFTTITRSITYGDTHNKTMGTAPYAMARMVRFITDTDGIVSPADDAAEYGQLTVAERTLDLLDNTTLSSGSDGLVDADTDADTLVNEGGSDVKEYVAFALDTTDPDNWKLTEQVPDYTTANTSDTTAPRVLCEHVKGFVTQQVSSGVVRIRLTTGANGMEAVLETRARSGLLSP